MNDTLLQQRLDLALAASRAAGELILSYFQSADLTVERKQDDSPVTIADKGAEELLRQQIESTFPDDGILGEEFEDKESKNEYRWILDPIDGTKSFVHGVPLFGTLIGLEQNKNLVLGVCRFPALNEVIYATTGNGCWWQQGENEPVRASVSTQTSLQEATFCTTTATLGSIYGKQKAYNVLLDQTKLARGWGDCYGHILVATGRADIMVDPELSPWDAAALVPILREAGGQFLDWSGKETIYGGDGFSVNAALSADVLGILQDKKGVV